MTNFTIVQDNMGSTTRHPSGIFVVTNKFEVFTANRSSLFHHKVNHTVNVLHGSSLIQNHAANLADITSTSFRIRHEDRAVADLKNFLGNLFLLVLLKSHKKSRNHRSTDHFVLKSLRVG